MLSALYSEQHEPSARRSVVHSDVRGVQQTRRRNCKSVNMASVGAGSGSVRQQCPDYDFDVSLFLIN